ncbi:MAG: sodium/proline symporter PutP [Pseudomonadota bacterium]
MTDQLVITATFGVYLIGMLGIGVWSFVRTHNLADYVLGGRSLGPLPSALSAGASDMSGWLLLGLPGYAYASGLEAIWIALGLFVGTWCNWRIVARRLRIYSAAAGDALTLPDFFAKRFDDSTHGLRVVCAVFIVLFFAFYTSAGLVAGGKLFESAFGLDYRIAVGVGAVAVVSYTLFGGFLAVAWTDVVQGLLMLVALIVVPIVVIGANGGGEATVTALRTENVALLNPLTMAAGDPLGVLALLSLLGWGLGYFGQPHVLARFMAIRSEKEVPAARRTAVAWTGISLAGALLAGCAAIAYFDAPLADAERVLIELMAVLFHPAVAGVLLAAILAAIMSTADSQLLVASSTLAQDFYRALLRPAASRGELLAVGRIAVAAIAIVATLIALDPESNVLAIVSYAWAGFGAAFGPALIFSLFWRRTTRAGVFAGIVVGGVVVIGWKQLSGGLFDLYELVPGFVLSAASVAVVSAFTTPASRSVLDRHDRLFSAG